MGGSASLWLANTPEPCERLQSIGDRRQRLLVAELRKARSSSVRNAADVAAYCRSALTTMGKSVILSQPIGCKSIGDVDSRAFWLSE